ncbi:MAG: hypothetical protein Ct9H300mP31_13590 [Acidimicrobiaceae bacterium]|nr:MAG: hypothetical protein Ct9H300mP31_13590 [Acidimicrobiaceae bacterium]
MASTVAGAGETRTRVLRICPPKPRSPKKRPPPPEASTEPEESVAEADALVESTDEEQA